MIGGTILAVLLVMLAAVAATVLGSILLPLFIVCFGVFLFVFWIWMLVDAIENKGLTDGEKVGWVLVVVFLHAFGALLYFIIARSKKYTPLRA
jgi:hypothetical protein